MTEEKVDDVARIIGAVFYHPAPDMSGDIWKALGPGLKQKCERCAIELLKILETEANK